MPQNAAGILHEPPVSVPKAPKDICSTIEIAAPDDEPPGARPRDLSKGLSGVP
jgi:hypothetical protein